jgi:glyoxylate reductase
MSRVFVTLPLPSPGIDMLKKRFEVTMMEAEGMPAEVLKQHIAEADPVGVVGMVNVPITEEIMAAAPHLRVVANYAVGYNNVDVAAATRRGVLVTNTPGVLTDATADLTFALILSVARRVVEADRFLREGKFKGWKADLLLGSDVYGRVLGIIGFGRIGQAVARRGLGFNMSILYSDARRATPEVESELRAQYVPLDELLRKSDYVTIHADLNDQTRHMIGERELKLMGPEHYLINAARGPIVDEKEDGARPDRLLERCLASPSGKRNGHRPRRDGRNGGKESDRGGRGPNPTQSGQSGSARRPPLGEHPAAGHRSRWHAGQRPAGDESAGRCRGQGGDRHRHHGGAGNRPHVQVVASVCAAARPDRSDHQLPGRGSSRDREW